MEKTEQILKELKELNRLMWAAIQDQKTDHTEMMKIRRSLFLKKHIINQVFILFILAIIVLTMYLGILTKEDIQFMAGSVVVYHLIAHVYDFVKEMISNNSKRNKKPEDK